MSDLSESQIEDLQRQIAHRRLDAVADLILDSAAVCYAMVTTGPDDNADLARRVFSNLAGEVTQG